MANRYAARANLKVDCTFGGTIFTGLVVRNLHVVPIGPTIVESIDVDYIRADYSLFDWWKHGATEVLKNAEVRTARIVLNPAKASLKPKIPRPDERITLFPVFPERIHLSGINLHVRSVLEAQDFVLEHLDVDLDPHNPGEIRIATLQLPNAPAWRGVSGRTSYTNKNLILSGLVLDDTNQIRLLAFDASHIAARSLEVVLDASLAGGTVAGSAALSETERSLNTKLRLVAENISLDTLRGYLGRPAEFLTGDVQRLEIATDGVVDAPRTWNGTLEAQISNLRRDNLFFDRCVLKVAARDGMAVLESGEATNGSNKLHLKGATELPEHIRYFGQSPARFEISAELPDLQSITARFPQPLTGSLTLQGTAEVKDAILRAAAQVKGTLKASKRMPATNEVTVYYSDLRSRIHAEMTDVHFGENLFDSVVADLSSEGAAVKLERVVTLRKENTMTIAGNYVLPDDLNRAFTQAANFAVWAGVVELGDYWPADSPNRITGPLQVSGEVAVRDGKAEGQVSFYGSNLKFRNLTVPQVSGQATVSKNVVYLNDFTATLNERDYIAGQGVFSLEAPHAYSGKLLASVADLARLKPVLAAAGNNNEIGGSLVIDWQGSGELARFQNSGTLKLTLEKGRYANLRALQANIDASYSPEGLDVPTIFLGSDKMDFHAILSAKGSTLEVSRIQIDQGQAKYATGYVSLPFVWKNIGTPEPLFPSDGKAVVSFQSENLDLKKLCDDLGTKPLATGLMNVKLEAQGPLAQLGGRLEVQMSDLHSANYPKLEPATFDLVAELQNNQLAFTGKLQQTKIQPVQITANIPFDVSKMIAERKFDEATPLSAKVQLPRSPVNFLRQFLPGITQLDGDLALDVNVTGTVASPVLGGAGDITINMARFTNPTLPSLSGFHSRLSFDRDVLNFERFNGDLAGGPFTISGRVTFPKLTEPNLDFELKAQSVLVARNDSLTARADADVKVTGPLKSATVTGNVALTNSQFLKNIDLLPIGLPGRPAPQPPSERPDFSVTEPPIRDWKFDVVIKTKDPFLIRGNLANGGAISDLHLTGTGLRPELQGTVRLENVEATLPFSRLEIAQGYLYFDPSDSFNPKIDLQGTSLIRDYTVHVYVYGTSLAPEAIFTSEPPLPQEEIISLLATGVTRGELIGNNNVLAGRAAMLLVQQLYRKVFKKGDQPAKSNSVFDRLQVDVGQVDPRTGQQTVTARLKVNEQFVLVGDLGVGGDFRGMVKYLIRFK
jgi:autotransporter translocation and assembly factor TamB